MAAAATVSGLVGRAFGELALERQRAARSGVGSAETEDKSRLDDVLVGESRSYERPTITEGGERVEIGLRRGRESKDKDPHGTEECGGEMTVRRAG